MSAATALSRPPLPPLEGRHAPVPPPWMPEGPGERVLRGAIVGAVAGAVAGFAMGFAASTLPKVQEAVTKAPAADDPAAARAAARARVGRTVRYATAVGAGALYGAAAEVLPEVTAGRGLAYGAAAWVVADEMGVPPTGFLEPPGDASASARAQALTSHLVYGVTLEEMRRGLRHVL